VSSILQMMAASNLENSQATRELRARLVEGHTKLSTEGSSRSGLVCPSSSENRFSLPPSRRLTPRSQRNRTRNTRFSSSLQSSTIVPSSPMLSREAQEASISSFPHEAIRRSQFFPRVSEAAQSIYPRQCSLGRLEKPPSTR